MKRAVLGDDRVEQLGVRDDGQEVLELPAGDHHEQAAGLAEAPQRAPGVVGDLAVVGEGSVVVSSQA